MKIHIVWDTSGSMIELGKLWIARGVARTIEQYIRLGYLKADLSLISWGGEARFVEWKSTDEFPPEMMVSEKPPDAHSLFSLIQEKNESFDLTLMLTDGFWSRSDTREIKRWREGKFRGKFRIIRIGADANPQIKGQDVFETEDLFAALDDCFEGGER